MLSRRFLSTVALTLSLTSGCSSSSSSPAVVAPPEASITPLCEYTPLGPTGSIRVPYWKKHLKDSAANFEFTIELDAPVGAAGASLPFTLTGTAVAGVHFQSLSPNPLVLAPGDTQATILIDLIPSGEFYHERSLLLDLGMPTGATLHPMSHRAELWIRPSVDPPVLSLASTTYQITAGGQANLDLSLSQACQEPVSFHYSVDGSSDLVDFAV
ncbi:MAG: hypothetical protein P1V35_13720, partial [Planctomycetota bacterium]|nr:hypothetical protein [Planctomycetota bacterium]